MKKPQPPLRLPSPKNPNPPSLPSKNCQKNPNHACPPRDCQTPVIVFICTLILFGLIVLAAKLISLPPSSEIPANPASFSVIDGDTFEISTDGTMETIRLLCVDSPEAGEAGYEEAGYFLQSLLLSSGDNIQIERRGLDKYNRTLAFAYVVSSNNSKTLINKALVDEGYADLFEYDNTNCSVMK